MFPQFLPKQSVSHGSFIHSVSSSSLNNGRNSLPSSRDGNGENRYSAVSPIASPTLDAGARDSGSSFCVSPIDEADPLPRHERNGSRTSAHAPVSQPQAPPSPPRTSQPAPKTVEFTANRKKPTRWDAFSGEPSDTGKASQVNPRDSTFHKPGSHATNLLNWGREQLQSGKLAQARSRIRSFSKSETPAQPEARGRSSSRVFPSEERSGSSSGTTDVNPPVNPALGFVPTVMTTITAGDSKSLPKRPATEHAPKSNTQEQPDNNFDTAMDTMLRPGQPVSRSGAPVPPHDSLNEPSHNLSFGSKSTEDLQSIMSRRRPVPVHMPVSKKPVRKPTPSEAGEKPTVALPAADNRPMDTHSRIASLEAKRDELWRRRVYLDTVIKDLHQITEPTSFADVATKEEAKKGIQSIRDEVAEIKREEHELGLKVTRAYRRLDEKENNGDGSNLWVKRVTS